MSQSAEPAACLNAVTADYTKQMEMYMLKIRRSGYALLLLLGMFTIVFLTASADTCVETRVYRKYADEKEYLNNSYIEKQKDGLFIRIISTLNTQIHVQKELRLDQSYATLKWKSQDLQYELEAIARRVKNTVHIRDVSSGLYPHGIGNGREAETRYLS